jgi:hypothetical protein
MSASMAAAQGPVLRDIHLPPAPHWWPPAPGWWLLAALLVVVAVFLTLRLRRVHRTARWRRRIRTEIDRIAGRHAAQADDVRLATELSAVLRRASLLLDPGAAALHGEAWLAFLDRHGGGEGFRHGPGRAMIDAPYRRAAEVDAAALLALSRDWIACALADRAPTDVPRGPHPRAGGGSHV